MSNFMIRDFCEKLQITNDFDREKIFLRNMLSPECHQCVGHQETHRNEFSPLTAERDPLDSIRENAHDEFVRNGIEVELDDLDVYQFRMRESKSATPPTRQPPTMQQPTFEMNYGSGKSSTSTTSAMEEYLEMRSRARRKKAGKSWCVFCKNNGELSEWYNSHTLKDNLGRTTCPILRRYVCPRCGISGDSAHTIRYCPRNEGVLEPALTQLLKTERMASGRRRVAKS